MLNDDNSTINMSKYAQKYQNDFSVDCDATSRPMHPLKLSVEVNARGLCHGGAPHMQYGSGRRVEGGEGAERWRGPALRANEVKFQTPIFPKR